MARLRLFLSHAESQLALVRETAERLEEKQVSCFYATRDIPRGEEWQPALTTALTQCDALVAFICGRFRKSEWTDQEVGYALGRDRFVISVMLGGRRLPHGFLSRDQAISGCDQADAIAHTVYNMLWGREEFRRLLRRSLVQALLVIRDDKRREVLAFACDQLATLPRRVEEDDHMIRTALSDNPVLRADRALRRRLNDLLAREA